MEGPGGCPGRLKSSKSNKNESYLMKIIELLKSDSFYKVLVGVYFKKIVVSNMILCNV